MELLLKIDHGSPAEISAAVDVFASFYRTHFSQSALKSSIKQQKMIYLSASVATSFTAICGIIMFFTWSSATYSTIMAFMTIAMLIASAYSIMRYKQVPDRCAKTIEANLDDQLSASKEEKQAIFETRFYENHMEASSNRQSKRPIIDTKRYSEIKYVYETDELYYFSGLTWILKSQLDDSQREVLAEIINKHFSGDRHRVVPAFDGGC